MSAARIGRYGPIYTKDLATAFLERVEKGEHVMQICADPDMPCWRTVQMWRRKKPAFAASYLRVREASAEFLEHEEGDKATDRDSSAAARVRIDTLKWAAAKRNPRTHGDLLRHSGPDAEGPIELKLKSYPGDPDRMRAQELMDLKRLYEKYFGLDLPDEARVRMIEGEAEEE
jgi:terminase small subunit-like protein